MVILNNSDLMINYKIHVHSLRAGSRMLRFCLSDPKPKPRGLLQTHATRLFYGTFKVIEIHRIHVIWSRVAELWTGSS